RIGGTPCLLWGLASFKRTSKRDSIMKAVCADQFRRAVLAFPDEDVLVGTRFIDAGAFQAFKGLEDICPRPGAKPTGEEPARSRRSPGSGWSWGRVGWWAWRTTPASCVPWRTSVATGRARPT